MQTMGADVYITFCIKKGNSSLPYSDPEGWAGATFKTWLRHCTLWNCFYYPTTRLWNSNTTLWYARLQGHPPPLLSSQLPPILPYLLASSHQNIINLVPMSLIEPSQGHLVSEIILKHYQWSFTTYLMLPPPCACVALPSHMSQNIVFFSLMC